MNNGNMDLFRNAGTVALPVFILNLVLAAVLAFVLGQAYIRFGHSLSNRRLFARNFLLLTLTTMLVISIVKSSLALSLGLVGALSIVRFRAAIKEPEELAYLFLAISIGLGLGANQTAVTVVALAVILAILAIRHLILYRRRPEQPNLYLTVTSAAPQKLTAAQVLEALTQSGATASLKRFDETPEQTEVALRVAFADVVKLEQFNRRVRELSEGVKLSYHEDHGLSA
jgi:uncharacterized membrane protein YhiD involved in acid resistance